MNGRQHYLEAERLLNLAKQPPNDYDGDALLVARAQVHATLAAADAALRYETNHQ